MKFKTLFTPQQKQILKRVCEIQIESLMAVYKEIPYDMKMKGIVILYEAEERDIEEVVIDNLSRVSKVKENPNLFFEVFTELDRRVVNHILLNWNNELTKISPEGIRNIWGKIFWAETIEEREDNLILN